MLRVKNTVYPVKRATVFYSYRSSECISMIYLSTLVWAFITSSAKNQLINHVPVIEFSNWSISTIIKAKLNPMMYELYACMHYFYDILEVFREVNWQTRLYT